MNSYILRDIESKLITTMLAVDEHDARARGGPRVAFVQLDSPWRLRLSELVERSGLSNREFARRVLGRDVRSLARYLGAELMPPELADQVMRMSIDSVSDGAIVIRIARGDDSPTALGGRALAVQVEFSELVGSRTALERAQHRLAVRRFLSGWAPSIRWHIDYRAVIELAPAEAPFALAIFEDEPSGGGSSRSVRVTDDATVEAAEDLVHQAVLSAAGPVEVA